MGGRTQTPQDIAEGNPRPEPGPGSDARDPSTPPSGTVLAGPALIAGKALVQTIRHFFPDLNTELDRLVDTRDQEAITYSTRFMAWWGICLYLFQLSSRRQLDFELASVGTQVLTNLNRLAQTHHDTRPVHDTLDYFVGHVDAEEFVGIRTQMARRLVRMKAVDSARLLGRLVVLVDGTGLICWVSAPRIT